MNLKQILMFTCLLAWARHDLTAAAPDKSPNGSLAVCVDKAWDIS